MMLHPSFLPSFLPSARLRLSLLAALPAALLLTACGKDGPTATPDPLVVTASLANVTGPAIFDATQRTPSLVRCVLQVRLSSTGRGRSEFTGGAIYRYAGASGPTPTDSLVLSPALLRQAFAAAAIGPAVPMLATWTVDDSIPFAMRVVVRHRVDGSDAEQALALDAPCGPTPSATTPAPEITNLSTTIATGDFEPGDTIVVRYDVSAPLGFWRATARLTGPCELNGATTQPRLATSTQMEFRFVMPLGCELGVPLQIQVTAADAALRTDTSGVATSLVLVDRIAPTLNGVEALSSSASPMLFTGDSVQLMVFARDNLGLRWITVSPSASGAVDSVAVPPGANFGSLIRFAVRDAWAGSTALRLRAIDRAGNQSAEHVTTWPSYEFFPSVTRPSAGATIPGTVRELAVDRQGRAHVVQLNQSRIVTLARGTLVPVATIRFTSPMALVATPSGDSLYVLHYSGRNLDVLDVRGETPVHTGALAIQGLDATKGERPGSLVVTARGTAVMIVSATLLADWRVVEVDLATGASTPLDVGTSGAPLSSASLVRSGDGRTVLLSTTSQSGATTTSCVRRWTVESGAFDACRNLQASPRLLDRTGTIAVAGLRVLDMPSGTSRPIALFARSTASFFATVIAPDGGEIYTASQSGLIRTRASDGAILGLYRSTASPDGFALETLRLSPDGKVAVIASNVTSETSRVITMELP